MASYLQLVTNTCSNSAVPYVSKSAIGIMVANGKLTIDGQVVNSQALLQEWLSSQDGLWQGHTELARDQMRETRLSRLTEWLSSLDDLFLANDTRHGNTSNDKELEMGYTNLRKWLSSIDDILDAGTMHKNMELRNDKK